MSVIKGLLRAKVRTLLNLIIMIVIAVAVCITLSLPLGVGGQKEFSKNTVTQSEEISESSVANSSENEQIDDNTAIKGIDDSVFQDGENAGDLQKTMPTNPVSAATVIILIGIAVVGVGLLITVNLVSTNKRKDEVSSMLLAGVDKKTIKKQFFIEAFLTVMVAGIIGTAIGAVVAAPVSNAIMESKISNKMANRGDVQPPFNENGEQIQKPTNENGEEVTMNGRENIQPADDENEEQRERSTDENGNTSGVTSDNDNRKPPADRPNNSANNYLLMCIASLCYTIGLSLISGFFCCNPIEKVSNKKVLDKEVKANE